MFLHEKILNIKRLPIPLLHTLKGLSQIDFNLLFRVVLDTLPFTLLRPVNLVFPIQKVKKPTNKSGSCFKNHTFALPNQKLASMKSLPLTLPKCFLLPVKSQKLTCYWVTCTPLVSRRNNYA